MEHLEYIFDQCRKMEHQYPPVHIFTVKEVIILCNHFPNDFTSNDDWFQYLGRDVYINYPFIK